jgi:hypothetical protein
VEESWDPEGEQNVNESICVARGIGRILSEASHLMLIQLPESIFWLSPMHPTPSAYIPRKVSSAKNIIDLPEQRTVTWQGSDRKRLA